MSYSNKYDFWIILFKSKTKMACLDRRSSFPGNKLHYKLHIECIQVFNTGNATKNVICCLFSLCICFKTVKQRGFNKLLKGFPQVILCPCQIPVFPHVSSSLLTCVLSCFLLSLSSPSRHRAIKVAKFTKAQKDD